MTTPAIAAAGAAIDSFSSLEWRYVETMEKVLRSPYFLTESTSFTLQIFKETLRIRPSTAVWTKYDIKTEKVKTLSGSVYHVIRLIPEPN